jgi:hypothetical protein
MLLLWTIAGLLTGGTFAGISGLADLVITTAGSDGFVMSSATSGSGDEIITGRIFGSGRTSVSRETGYGDITSSRLSDRSDGPLLIGEYVSSQQKESDNPLICVFGNRTGETAESELETSGILQQGRYESMLTMQPFEYSVFANGTGLIDLRHKLTGNGSVTGRTVASGNLSVSEMAGS